MKTETSQSILPTRLELSGAVLASLPKLEELPERSRQELIQALAALLLHDPQLQAVLEARHEPEQ